MNWDTKAFLVFAALAVVFFCGGFDWLVGAGKGKWAFDGLLFAGGGAAILYVVLMAKDFLDERKTKSEAATAKKADEEYLRSWREWTRGVERR